MGGYPGYIFKALATLKTVFLMNFEMLSKDFILRVETRIGSLYWKHLLI